MGQTLRFRLFGIGRMPDGLRPALAGGGVLHFVEGIRVAVRMDGAVPGGGMAYGFRRSLSGAFVLQADRVLATAGKTKILDARFAEADESGPGLIRIEPDGLHFEVDLARAVPNAKGEIRMHFQDLLDDALRSRLPRKEMRVALDAQGIASLFRHRKLL